MDVDTGFMSADFAAFKSQGLWVSMHRVADYRAPRWPDPASPQQMHLDFTIDDLDEAEQRAVALGATKAGSNRHPNVGA